MSELNNSAPANISLIFVTLDTTHLLKSELNCGTPENIPLISVTLDTSQFSIPLKSVRIESIKSSDMSVIWLVSISPKNIFLSVTNFLSSCFVFGRYLY